MASSVTAGNSTESAGQHYSTATTLRLYDDNNCLSVCYTRSVPAGGRFDRERERDGSNEATRRKQAGCTSSRPHADAATARRPEQGGRSSPGRQPPPPQLPPPLYRLLGRSLQARAAEPATACGLSCDSLKTSPRRRRGQIHSVAAVVVVVKARLYRARCSQLIHRPIGRYRRSKHRKSLTGRE